MFLFSSYTINEISEEIVRDIEKEVIPADPLPFYKINRRRVLEAIRELEFSRFDKEVEKEKLGEKLKKMLTWEIPSDHGKTFLRHKRSEEALEDLDVAVTALYSLLAHSRGRLHMQTMSLATYCRLSGKSRGKMSFFPRQEQLVDSDVSVNLATFGNRRIKWTLMDQELLVKDLAFWFS